MENYKKEENQIIMCGIIGIASRDKNVKGRLVDSLKRLEYRGYDSSGIALRIKDGIFIKKRQGRVAELEEELKGNTFNSEVGIGHTRWATHGEPSCKNSHPHTDCTGKIALVHNGIIENYKELKKELEDSGHIFTSSTDTEVIAHLIEENLKEYTFIEAFRKAVKTLEGSFAIVALFSEEGSLYVARKDSPLVIGIGDRENFVASDVPAFLPWTDRVIFLEDGEMCKMTPNSVETYNFEGKSLKKEVIKVPWNLAQAEKGGYKHFMLKEIYEQGKAVGDTIGARLERDDEKVALEGDFPIPPEEIERILILACGTSYHAGLVGKFYLEEISGIPVYVDYGSEFRYRKPIINEKTLVIAVSQSGETADTIGAVRLAREKGARIISICNVLGSTLTRISDVTFHTYAGPEISVASTKAFTTQLSLFFLLALDLGSRRGFLSDEKEREYVREILSLPVKIEDILKKDKKEGIIREIAVKISSARNALYLGRNVNYPIALEGALKLKEISYIHAEGYPAGEMKHGPIALIDEETPTVFIATESSVLKKVKSNMEEIKSRNGKIISLVSDGEKELSELSDYIIRVPGINEYLAPILNIIPLQLLAYHAADYLGHDVDQPRNLAKSVTVE